MSVPKNRIRETITANHIAAVRRGVKASKQFAADSETVKMEIAKLIALKDPQSQRRAMEMAKTLAAHFDSEIGKLVRDQSEDTYRRVLKALDAAFPQNEYTPFSPILSSKSASIPNDTSNLGPIAAFFALIGIGVVSGIVGNPLGTATAGMGIDRLTARARRVVQSVGIAASNHAAVSAVELIHNVPVAKRIPVAKLIPYAKLIKLGPVVHRPFPNEPEFELIPQRRRQPITTQPLPPVDPDPPFDYAWSPKLAGWQVYSMDDDRVRPKHAERHGRKYYYNPDKNKNQSGIDELPNPPYESAKDGHVLAHGCRCWIVPVFFPRG